MKYYNPIRIGFGESRFFRFTFKRNKWKFGPFRFHLYRVPVSLASKWFEDNMASNYGEKKPYKVTWEKWKSKIKKVCPIQFWFRHDLLGYTFDFERNIFDPIRYWWITEVKDRINPYNVLKIRTMKRTYSDDREKLIHANFEILSQFVEAYPQDMVNYNSDEYWSNFWKEAMELYVWWITKEKREKVYQKRLDDIYETRNTDKEWAIKFGDVEEEMENDIDDHLIRLIKIRRGMWT